MNKFILMSLMLLSTLTTARAVTCNDLKTLIPYLQEDRKNLGFSQVEITARGREIDLSVDILGADHYDNFRKDVGSTGGLLRVINTNRQMLNSGSMHYGIELRISNIQGIRAAALNCIRVQFTNLACFVKDAKAHIQNRHWYDQNGITTGGRQAFYSFKDEVTKFEELISAIDQREVNNNITFLDTVDVELQGAARDEDRLMVILNSLERGLQRRHYQCNR